MPVNIVAINLGGTSSKIAYFVDNQEVFKENIMHSREELEPFGSIFDQLDFRLAKVIEVLTARNVKLSEISAVVTRAGVLPPINAGGYAINDAIIEYTTNYNAIDHASNLGAKLADKLGKQAGPEVKAYIYDGETMDQLMPIAKISGAKSIPKQSIGHLLNMRAVARVAAQQQNRAVEECRYVVAHMGGGTSVCAIQENQIIDVLADDEGPCSVERAGSLALKHVINLCYQIPKKEVLTILRKEGGLYSYLQTNDGQEIEQRILAGDEYAALVYEALAYQVAKACGDMAVALQGKVDGIILTGGLAHSDMICQWVQKWAGFIGEIIVIPGECEMEALAGGAYRIAKGMETSQEFVLPS